MLTTKGIALNQTSSFSSHFSFNMKIISFILAGLLALVPNVVALPQVSLPTVTPRPGVPVDADNKGQ